MNGLWVFFVASSMSLSWFGYFLAERRLRGRWQSTVLTVEASESPYRATAWVREAHGQAPPIVRGAAWSGILFGGAAVPGVTYAVATLRFDGIALSLLPGIAAAVASWCVGWLLLARSPAAVELGKLTARTSTTANVLVLALAILHVLAARVGWSDRESIAYVAVGWVLAAAALLQAMILRIAVERHGNAFGRIGPTFIPLASGILHRAPYRPF
ncbi:MAG: hypothetical protein WBY94_14985 [Polyangiaceae bacterium]